VTTETETIAGLHHLVLFCADTEASRRWYEIMGFAYLRGHDGMHWFRLGDAELMLHPAEPGTRRGLPALHAAVPDVDAAFRRALAAGLTPYDHQQPDVALTAPVLRPWGDREFELDDPDGHRWGFTQG
jgi:catechol 2,3-dioxygenase-like lactoylglutathione lyase family enzyme